MGLIAHTSQTYYLLLEKWIERILHEQRDKGPHISTIVVPNHSIASWLNREMATRLGISMNLRFVYFDSLLADSAHTEQEDSEAGATTLQWAVALCALIREEENRQALLPLLNDGLERPLSELQSMQIAWEFATLFQQYAEHRLTWLPAWERNLTLPNILSDLPVLQKNLYRKMLEKGVKRHPLHHVDFSASEICNPSDVAIHFFGFWNFSAGKWQVIEQIAQHREVILYLPFPTEGYLADLTRKTLQQPLLLGEDGAKMGPNYQLLSRLGQRGRALQMQLLDHEVPIAELEQGELQESSPLSRLAAVQAQLGNPDTFEAPATSFFDPSAQDNSIQIHSVCNHRREVEVARAMIQQALADDPDLPLESIQIQAPDITDYAPILSEVFADESPQHSISLGVQNSVEADKVPAIRALIELVQLLCSQWESGQIKKWLAQEPVRQALEFSHAELELINHWITCASIFRGRPPADVEASTIPHSWEYGMRLLMQAYAGNLQGDALGTTGFDMDPPNQHPETFSKFCAWYAFMKQAASALILQNQSPSQFRNTLSWMIARVLPRSNEFEKQVLLSAVNRLADQLPRSFLADTTTYLYLLRKSLPTLPPPQALSRKSGVQCTSIQAENMTPCRIRILLGMNESDFPSVDVPHSHNLIQLSENEANDPSRKEDQRYWILQSLHQTSQQWIVIFQGQDASGSASRLLSPAIESVIQSVNRIVIGGGTKVTSSQATFQIRPLQHPRFAYDAENFTEGGPPCFSQEDFRVAELLANPKAQVHSDPFRIRVNSTHLVTDKDLEIDIWGLAAFFAHPNQYVCERHMGIRFPKTLDFSPDHEPLLWKGLGTSYPVNTDFLRSEVKKLDSKQLKSVLQSYHLLLPGTLETLGVEWMRAEFGSIPRVAKIEHLQLLEALSFKTKTSEFNSGIRLHHATIEDSLPPFTVLGTIRASRLSSKHRLEAWVHLLSLWQQQSAENRAKFVLIAKDTTYELVPPDNPAEILGELLDIFQHYHAGPVPLFPKTSEAYVRKPENLESMAQVSAWEGDHGEKLDPYNEYMFRNTYPFTKAFAELSEIVWRPLLNHSPTARWNGGGT